MAALIIVVHQPLRNLVMADNTLLNLAKQGKPGAIAAMLNRSFQKEGWTCKGRTNGNELKLTFEGENPPQLEQIRDRLMRGLKMIQPEGIEVLNLEARKTGQLRPVWNEIFYLSNTENSEDRFKFLNHEVAQPSGRNDLVYDQNFAIRTAERLHGKAQSIIIVFCIVGAFFGFSVGFGLGAVIGGIVGAFLFGALCGFVGWFIGQFIGMSLSLSIEGQAQLLYAQIQTEINTRKFRNENATES